MVAVKQFRRAIQGARRQTRLWRQSVRQGRPKRGHARAAKRWKRRADALKKDRAATIKRYLRPGPPGWGGGALIMFLEVWPIMKRRGISPTSGKRRETFGNPSSDHFFLNRYAFAKDWATANNYAAANEIRRKLDGPEAMHADYQNFYITRWGKRFRVQIIAGTHGTGPHLHVGIARVS